LKKNKKLEPKLVEILASVQAHLVGIYTELALESCQAVADMHFSIADLRKVDQWSLEYLSLRENPPKAFLATGETPV
jgi:hypothetical protein